MSFKLFILTIAVDFALFFMLYSLKLRNIYQFFRFIKRIFKTTFVL